MSNGISYHLNETHLDLSLLGVYPEQSYLVVPKIG